MQREQGEPLQHLEHEDDGTRGSFVLRDGGHRVAVLTYQRSSRGVITADHTWVDDGQRGRGLAGRLTSALVEWARGEGLSIVPACSYVAAWLERPPEQAAAVAHGVGAGERP